MMYKCVACGKELIIPILSGIRDLEYATEWRGEIRICGSCQLAQQVPMPTLEEALAYYPDVYVQYNPQPGGVRGMLMKMYMKRTIRLLQQLGVSPGQRLLDIGCAAGEKLSILRDTMGLEVVGTEPNRYAAQKARKIFGLKVYDEPFPSPKTGPESFDFVRINHVIEHVQEPVKLLNDICRVLKPGGWVVGETENIECKSFVIFNRFWALLHVPYHLLFFKKASLQKVFGLSFFKTVHIKSVADPTVWSLSLQNYMRRNKVPEECRRSRMPGYLLVTLAALPVAWLENSLGSGPVFEFWAQKVS